MDEFEEFIKVVPHGQAKRPSQDPNPLHDALQGWKQMTAQQQRELLHWINRLLSPEQDRQIPLLVALEQ